MISICLGLAASFLINRTLRREAPLAALSVSQKALLGDLAGKSVALVGNARALAEGQAGVILSSALAFSVVKWLGAAYLVYLGVQSLLSMWRGESKIVENKNVDNNKNVFVQGVIVSVLNPKVALFFLSFLPQFIDTSASSTSMQLLVLGLLFSVLATTCNVLYASVGNWVFSRPHSQRYSRTLEGVSGILLISLASKVAFSER